MKISNPITRRNKRPGFSLPEVMVSVAIIAAVVISSTSLLINSSRSNNLNANKLTAFHLAQEGIELTRNIRDSNWLHGLNWRGTLNKKNILTKSELKEGSFIIDRKGLGTRRKTLPRLKTQIEISNIKELQNHTPWEFEATKCSFDENNTPQQFCDQAKLKIHTPVANELNNFKIYSHQEKLNDATQIGDSKFYRIIQIKDITQDKSVIKTPPDSDSLHFQLKSIVIWQSDNGNYEKLELETELTDWKQGPI